MTKYRGRARYELSTDQWNKIKDLLPEKAEDRGRLEIKVIMLEKRFEKKLKK